MSAVERTLKTVRCRDCNAVLVEIYIVEVIETSKVVAELAMRCRNKHCVSRKKEDPHHYFDFVVEGKKAPGVSFKEKRGT